MVAPNYPNNPTLGQQYVVGNKTFEWDGEKWRALSNADASLRSQLKAQINNLTLPTGGAVIDTEARQFISDLVDAINNL